jgi:hypothetical protein
LSVIDCTNSSIHKILYVYIRYAGGWVFRFTRDRRKDTKLRFVEEYFAL